MSDETTVRLRGGEVASAISNRVVRLISEHTGRGPTRARTYIHDDLISVVVRDGLTRAEQRLVRDGKSDVVLGVRRAFQETMRTELVAAVEELSARRVMAFLSANHIDPDIALESFLLAPLTHAGELPDLD